MWTLKCTKRSEKQIEFTLANCMPNRKKTKPLLCYPCLSNQSATSFPGSSHLTALWGASEVGSKMINPQLCTRQRDQIKRQKKYSNFFTLLLDKIILVEETVPQFFFISRSKANFRDLDYVQ